MTRQHGQVSHTHHLRMYASDVRCNVGDITENSVEQHQHCQSGYAAFDDPKQVRRAGAPEEDQQTGQGPEDANVPSAH